MPDEPDVEDRKPQGPADWDGKAVIDLMSTPHGRRLMERFLDYCEPGNDRYKHDGDALGMAWRDGLAHAGNFWEQMLLHHCPDLYLKMVKERRSRLERDRERVAKRENRRDPSAAAPLEMTSVEQAADEQRLAAEAAEEARRKASAKRGKSQKPGE